MEQSPKEVSQFKQEWEAKKLLKRAKKKAKKSLQTQGFGRREASMKVNDALNRMTGKPERRSSGRGGLGTFSCTALQKFRRERIPRAHVEIDRPLALDHRSSSRIAKAGSHCLFPPKKIASEWQASALEISSKREA